MSRFALFLPLLFLGFNLHATVFEWIGDVGDWNTATNWQPQGIPSVLDTAIIQSGTVQLSQTWTVGRLELDASVEIAEGFLLLVFGSFAWANGAIDGHLLVNDGAQAHFADGDLRSLRGLLELRGTTTHSSGILRIDSGELRNIGWYQLAGGTIEIEATANFTNFSTFSVSGGPDQALAGNGLFLNESSAIFSNENGPANFQIGVNFEQAGIFDVHSPNLTFSRDLSLRQGFTYFGPTFNLSTQKVRVLGDIFSIIGIGYTGSTWIANDSIILDNIMLEVFSNWELNANIAGDSFSSLSVNNDMVWNAGNIAVEFTSFGNITIPETAQVSFNEGLFINNGVIDQSGEWIFEGEIQNRNRHNLLAGFLVFENEQTVYRNYADLFISSSIEPLRPDSDGGIGQLINEAPGGNMFYNASEATWLLRINFENRALLDIIAAVVDFQGRLDDYFGINFISGVEWRTQEANFYYSPDVTFPNLWRIQGPTTVQGFLTTFTDVIVSDSISCSLGWRVSASTTIEGEYVDAPIFVDGFSGLLDIPTGFGPTTFTSNIENAGTMLVTREMVCQNNLELTNTGFLLIGESGQMMQGVGSMLNQGDLSLDVLDTEVVQIDLDLTNEGSISGLGQLLTTASVLHNGLISPGFSPGRLGLSEPSFEAGNVLRIELQDESGPGAGHDILEVEGEGVLDGTLDIRLLEGYLPEVGSEFVVMTCSSACSGSFSEVLWPVNSDNWELQYNADDIRIRVVAPLPAELLDFAGTAHPRHNELQWTTAQEQNVSHFELYRSESGTHNWQLLGNISAASQSDERHDYQFQDPSPLPQAYYRLQILDLDGQMEFSELIFIDREEGIPSLMVYPNPATDFVQLQWADFNGTSAGGHIAETRGYLLAPNGQLVRTYELVTSGSELDLRGLAKGSYILWLEGTDIRIALTKK